jgi:hypothetical protein
MAMRNYTGIQHADLRAAVEGPFNALHDELTDAFYSGAPFRDLGVLDKPSFDRLHGLIFHELHLALIAEDDRRPTAKKADREKLDPEIEPGRRQSDVARETIARARADGHRVDTFIR